MYSMCGSTPAPLEANITEFNPDARITDMVRDPLRANRVRLAMNALVLWT